MNCTAVELFHSLRHRILQMLLQQCLLLHPQRWNTNTPRPPPSHPLLGLPPPPPPILLLLLLLFPPAPCSSMCSRRCRKENSLTRMQNANSRISCSSLSWWNSLAPPLLPLLLQWNRHLRQRSAGCATRWGRHRLRGSSAACDYNVTIACVLENLILVPFGSLTPPIPPPLRPDCAARTC